MEQSFSFAAASRNCLAETLSTLSVALTYLKAERSCPRDSKMSTISLSAVERRLNQVELQGEKPAHGTGVGKPEALNH